MSSPMFVAVLLLHVMICLVLVIAILIQSGKGGGLVSAFGTSGGHAIFGGRGAATFLSKATTILGAGFMVTSLLLALLSGTGVAGGSKKGALEKEAERAAAQQEGGQSLPPSGQSPFAAPGAEGGAGAPAPGPAGSPGGAPAGKAMPAPSSAPSQAPSTPPSGNPPAGQGH
jgi:preprotein translocase subunit SecG